MKGKIKAKVTITAVTGWTEDTALEAGDASHEGDAAIRSIVAGEIQDKLDSHKWDESNLPITFEATLEEDAQQDAEEAAIEHLNDGICENEYFKPSDVEVEYEIISDENKGDTIAVNPEEPIFVIAISIAGWGKGKTLHEALRNLKSASRGMIDKDYGMTLYPDGKKRKYDFAYNLEKSHIRLWLTNDPTFRSEWYNFIPSKGKWAMFLGDCDNDALCYLGTKEG